MCGIAGNVSRQPLEPRQLEQLDRMSQALIHRGPDGSGLFRADHVALAIRRLAIIDPATGWQPLYNEDESLVLVANGEIYNYVELRRQLQDRGHHFRTGSDCEVILHLYEELGSQCVHRLRGMFAFALWDKRANTLLLARDRMGEKPLYLYETEGSLVFASELRALLRAEVAPFRLDLTAIDHFFHYQYVPDPMTALEGVRKLRPGHLLSVTLDPWRVEETCYWRMDEAPPLEGDPASLIRAELETISSLTIRSDVPVGISLSGGLDSSLLAVLASRRYPGTMHAFSAGYTGRPHSDERSNAAQLAKHLGLPFHDVEINTSDVVRTFPDMVFWQDDPVADLSSFGYFAIAKEARRQGVPVLLQGQGADELFWGYPWVREAWRHSVRKSQLGGHPPRFEAYLQLRWPRFWPRRAPIDWVRSLAGLRSSWSHYQRDRVGPADRLVFYDLDPTFQRATQWTSRIYSPQFRRSLNGSSSFDLFTAPRPWPQLEIEITRLICGTYLLNNGIARGDRVSMASSIELRLPLVDHRLVETVIGLRKGRSDVGLPPKAWLRQAVQDIVPEWVLNRRKRGFQPPTRAWHRAIFDRYGGLLVDGMLVELGILRPDAARRLGSGPYSLAETEPFSLSALVLEIWCRQTLAPATLSTSPLTS
jgi:asparagine synthase (glutamine-hydrolysing)